MRARVLVSGRVQGVSFRWYTAQQAHHHGVGGWVRNLADGRVEAVFEGPKPQVEALVAWCGRGPSSARVTGIHTTWEDPEDLFTFEIE